MPSENAEFIRRIFEAFPRTQHRLKAGTQAIGPPLSPDIVWDSSDLALPDMGDGVVHGYGGVRRFWMSWLAPWDEISFDFEIFESGQLVLVDIHQQHKTGALAVDAHYAQIWTFEGDEVVHFKIYMDPAAAFKAAGLEQPSARARQS